MMERNKVKIICNPYNKTIEYKRWGHDANDGTFKWMDLGSKSKLIVDKKFSHVTIQHNAFEIINEIAEEYNRGNAGLDIVFDGTEEDYFDLNDVTEQFFSENGIVCVKGDLYIESADTIMPKIQEVFTNMSKVFSEYGSEEIKTIVGKYMDVTKTVIPICVVGMYSTGKSAFINALIGEEVLPSAVNPTTARNYKIIEADCTGKVIFFDEKEKIEIVFDGSQYNITGNIDRELKRGIEHSLGEEIESVYRGVYQALRVLNEYADTTGKIAEMIEVEVPFCNGVLKSEEYDFVIFDTPGSDSKSHEEHIKVLKNALGEQTNGLPILLTSPKDMDRTGADTLLNAVNGIDGNLDLTNAMIIVNQADGVSSKSLDKVKLDANTILSQWKSNRLYFISAILGLGSKKYDYNNEDSWMDEDYLEVFLKNSDSFCKPDSRLYKQLYLHNQIAENRKDRYIKQVEDCKRERELIYINSGLHCVETEIVEFAKKFALYNKCAQAEDYLIEAIDCASDIIDKKEKQEETLKMKISDEQELAKKELLLNLDKIIQQSCSQFGNEYPKHMEGIVEKMVEKEKERVSQIISESWDKIKEKDKAERVSLFLDDVKRKYKSVQSDIREKLFAESKKFWDVKRETLQYACCNLIKEDEYLTAGEQEYLKKFIMNLKYTTTRPHDIDVSVEDISKYVVNIWGIKVFRRNIVDQNTSIKIFDENLEKYVRRINNSTIELHKREFKDWNKRLRVGLTKEIGSLNPTLREYAKKLGELQLEIEEIQKIQEIIMKNHMSVNKMFDFKTREVKE